MAVLMIVAVSTTSAFAITPGDYPNPSFSTWPISHGELFDGDAVVTNAIETVGENEVCVSTVKVPINTEFVIYNVPGEITDVTLNEGYPPYISAELVTEDGVTYLVVKVLCSVSADDFAPNLTFAITVNDHPSSTSGEFRIVPVTAQ